MSHIAAPIAVVAALAGLAATAPALRTATSARPSPADQPVVIELYQSQGCSSCPPALAVLDQLANRPDVVALNFAVTYWDQLGWKDTYARPEFTARQWEYARAGGRGNVATPQLIVAGRQAVLGSRKAEVDAAIEANRRADGPAIGAAGGRVTVGPGKASRAATVWLAIYDPRRVAVPIAAGENGGRTLPHRNIVKRLTALGVWTGKPVSFALAPIPSPLARAILVQAGKGGPILAARRL